VSKASAPRVETIADLIKMIKKNVEKGSSGDEEGEEEIKKRYLVIQPNHT
jgi:hypothetical protein